MFFSLIKILLFMRKSLMMVAAAFLLMGTTVTTKAATLLKVSKVSVSQNIEDENGLVLKHASELFGNGEMSMAEHGSHSSHSSHASHVSGS